MSDTTQLEQTIIAIIIHAEVNSASNALFNESREVGVTEAFFTNHLCASAWTVMEELEGSSNVIDEVSVMTRLTAKKVDVQDYFALMSMAKSELHFKQKLNELVESYRRRQCSRLARQMQEAIDEGDTSEEVLGLIEHHTTQINDLSPSTITLDDQMDNMLADLFGDPNLSDYMPVGIPQFDANIWRGGFGPKQLCVIAARPGCGKTAIALNFARNNCNNRGKVLFFNLEMGHEQMLKRLVSIESGMSTRHLEGGVASEHQRDTMAAASDVMRGWDLIIKDNIYSLAQILAVSRGLHRKGEVGAIVVDYCQLVKPMTKGLHREQQVAEISRELKLLAKDLNVPVILLAQLNRSSEKDDRAPIMSDLRESGALEQDADSVTFLWQTLEEKEQGVPYVRWVLAKQREGIGYASGKFGFQRETQRMMGYEDNVQ